MARALLEVSRRSNVSIGSIYGRVDGKSSLLRVVDQRMLARLNEGPRAPIQ